jgi:hypothetical protein
MEITNVLEHVINDNTLLYYTHNNTKYCKNINLGKSIKLSNIYDNYASGFFISPSWQTLNEGFIKLGNKSYMFARENNMYTFYDIDTFSMANSMDASSSSVEYWYYNGYFVIKQWIGKSKQEILVICYDHNWKILFTYYVNNSNSPGYQPNYNYKISVYDTFIHYQNKFYDINTQQNTNSIVLRRWESEELIAEAEVDSDKIKYILRPIVFSEYDCAVCLTPLKERWCSIPCGHTNVCKKCLTNLHETKKPCCICRKPIEAVMKLHI